MKNLLKEINIFDKIAFFLFLVLVIIIPWHAFWVTFISSFFGSSSEFLPKISFFLSSWKEIIVLFLWVLFLWKWIFTKQFPIKKFYIFDYIFFIFLWIALLSWAFLSKSFIQWFWGFRLDFVYFVLFYLARWFLLEKNSLKKIIKFFLVSWVFSLLFWFWLYSYSFNRVPEKINITSENYKNLTDEKKEFLKEYYWSSDFYNNEELQEALFKIKEDSIELKDFFAHHEQINFRNENFLNLMEKFGYSTNISSYNPDKPLAAFHFVEARWTARFSWTSSWPNQMWFFLIVFLWLIMSIFSFIFKSKIKLWKYEIWFISLSFLIWLLALYFTYSRSAWLWSIWIFWLFVLFSMPKKLRIYTFIWGLISWIALLFSLYFFANDFWNRVLVREWSSSVHFQKMHEWIVQVVENPVWLWLGMAWPVTIRFSEWDMQNISENWFIQMFQEFWVHWWLVYLIFLVFFIYFLIKNHNKNYLIYWGFLWLSWILIAWIFLHSFEDIWVSLLLFLILWAWIWVKSE